MESRQKSKQNQEQSEDANRSLNEQWEDYIKEHPQAAYESYPTDKRYNSEDNQELTKPQSNHSSNSPSKTSSHTQPQGRRHSHYQPPRHIPPPIPPPIPPIVPWPHMYPPPPHYPPTFHSFHSPDGFYPPYPQQQNFRFIHPRPNYKDNRPVKHSNNKYPTHKNKKSKNHLDRDQNENEEMTNGPNEAEKIDTTYCKGCDFDFPTSSSYQIHLKSHVNCKYCLYESTPKNLIEHLKNIHDMYPGKPVSEELLKLAEEIKEKRNPTRGSEPKNQVQQSDKQQTEEKKSTKPRNFNAADKYYTMPCKYFEVDGHCPNGEKCTFIHNFKRLHNPIMPYPPPALPIPIYPPTLRRGSYYNAPPHPTRYEPYPSRMHAPQLRAMEPQYKWLTSFESKRALVTSFGVVIGLKEPTKTKGIDYGMTIVITDPTLPLNVNGLSINMFKPKLQDFPDIQIGDITNVFGRRIQGVVSRHAPEYVKILTEGSLDMNLLDSTIFSNLKGWYNSLKDSSMIPKKTFESKRPLLQIKDIQVGQFFDLVCKIVCKPNRSNNFQILGITDYTCNIQLLEPPLLLESEDLMGIQENMVIVCTLWDQYSTFHGIEVGSLVLLRNLKGKLDINGRLEVALNGDQFEPYHFIKLLSYQSPEIQTLKS
ncbi:hypothetical protein HDV02_004515 [Globomyces sp. JEL0801]|nr:hypothetical protein HDV02_004515 [Globomyces sp. JEL0801]